MTNLAKFISLDYYFNPIAASRPLTLVMLAALFAALVAAGLVIKILQRTNKKLGDSKALLDKYSVLFLLSGCFGLLLLGFRVEQIYFFSARFWLIVLLLASAFALGKILDYQFRILPRARRQSQEREQLQKYLPKRR